MAMLIRGGTVINHDHSRRADVLINTEMRSAKDVAQQVIHQFLAARSGA